MRRPSCTATLTAPSPSPSRAAVRSRSSTSTASPNQVAGASAAGAPLPVSPLTTSRMVGPSRKKAWRMGDPYDVVSRIRRSPRPVAPSAAMVRSRSGVSTTTWSRPTTPLGWSGARPEPGSVAGWPAISEPVSVLGLAPGESVPGVSSGLAPGVTVARVSVPGESVPGVSTTRVGRPSRSSPSRSSPDRVHAWMPRRGSVGSPVRRTVVAPIRTRSPSTVNPAATQAPGWSATSISTSRASAPRSPCAVVMARTLRRADVRSIGLSVSAPQSQHIGWYRADRADRAAPRARAGDPRPGAGLAPGTVATTGRGAVW